MPRLPPRFACLPTATSRGAAGLALAVALTLGAALGVQVWQLALVAQAQRPDDHAAAGQLAQLEIETWRLQQQWQRALAEPNAATAGLRSRYDAWVGQVEQAREAPVRALMQGDAHYTQTLQALEAFVRQADPQLAPAFSGTPASGGLAALRAPLEALGPPAQALARGAGQRLAQREQARLEALQRLAWLAVALTALLGVLGAAVARLGLHGRRQGQARRDADEALAVRLRQAQRDAEAATAAKNDFLAQVSHEMRTPFQGLLGMLALLRDSPMSPRQAEHLRAASESAEQLLAVLNDSLDLSLLESGQLALDTAALSVPALLRQVETLMRPPAAARSLLLHFDAEPAVPEWIQADGRRVKQVLISLMTEVVRCTARGSVSLDVRLSPHAPARLLFVVSPGDIGADADREAGPDRDAAGASLGLEMARHLARMMGGTLQVQPVPGQGRRFTLELPLQRAAKAPTTAAKPAAPVPVAGPGSALRPLHVLVAEDHPVNRQYLASLLEALQHRAHFVGDGRAAVAAVQAERFDLVLMDLHMPVLDGIGATRAIRALPDLGAATLPIIALTADALQDTRERCLLAGMNDFLSKPVSPQDLAGALRRLYGQGAAAAPASGLATAPPPSSPGVELIDRGAIDRILGSLRTERLAALIEEYLAAGPKTLSAMRAAVRDGQPLRLREHAHAARGAALNLGLAALAQTAQTLHEGAAHLPAHEIAHLLQRFEDLLARTRQAAVDAGLLPAGQPAG